MAEDFQPKISAPLGHCGFLKRLIGEAPQINALCNADALGACYNTIIRHLRQIGLGLKSCLMI